MSQTEANRSTHKEKLDSGVSTQNSSKIRGDAACRPHSGEVGSEGSDAALLDWILSPLKKKKKKDFNLHLNSTQLK